MAGLRLWFDREADFFEITFAEREGEFREIGPDVYERVDQKGNVIGFAVFNFSNRDRSVVEVPLEVTSVRAP